MALGLQRKSASIDDAPNMLVLLSREFDAGSGSVKIRMFFNVQSGGDERKEKTSVANGKRDKKKNKLKLP